MGLEISVAGFGAWATGGSWQYGLGPQDDADSIAAIHRALELGVNWIDTAAAYGFGHSEEVVALALRGVAERPYLFTKCGLPEGPGRQVLRNLSRESIRSECEASLRRLGVDAIDLYQIHWPIPDEDIEEGWAALAELKAEGKVRHIGVSNFDTGQLERAEAIAPVESLQPPYSLIERGVEADALPWCAQRDVGVIVYSPMASGLLSGSMTRERIAAFTEDDSRRTNPAYVEPALSRNLELADRLRAIGERHGVAPGAVAVAWTLRRPEVTAAIVGFRRPAQVEGILPVATELELSDEELAELER
jgi:aryl-alcohol dehydrogenase-like predicted oxidoreductase